MEKEKITKFDKERTKTTKLVPKETKDDDVEEEEKKKEFIFQDLEYGCKIKYVYHISDIHIQLYKRHDEYRIQFSKFMTI